MIGLSLIAKPGIVHLHNFLLLFNFETRTEQKGGGEAKYVFPIEL